MNKSELAKAVSEKTSLPAKQVMSVLDATFDEITDQLKAKSQVAIAGFGTFATKDRAAREGRNPSTKEVIQIPAKTVSVFKPAKNLKEL